mmetsp:Transcript_7836/g.31027  ORF Transcript_7836/g.31027 Transcript_7836/m.31027 type:complete len:203 (+) Transcript_7836:725-1333(+)
MPPHLRHPPRLHRPLPRPVQRRGGGRAHRRFLLDPVPRRSHVHRGQERRQRICVALPLRRRRPAARLARYHRVPGAARAPRRLAAHLAKGDDPGPAQERRSRAAAVAGDPQVPPVHDRILLPQRPRRSHALLVRQQHLQHRADGVPEEDDRGAGDASRRRGGHAHAGYPRVRAARARGVRAQVPEEGGPGFCAGAQAAAAQG